MDFGRTRIVVAHADRDVLVMQQSLFERNGFEVIPASDGNLALAYCQLRQPELLILSLRLEKRSGFLVMEELIKAGVDASVIVTSDIEGKRHREYAELLGARAYLLEPLVKNQLMQAVESCLFELAEV